MEKALYRAAINGNISFLDEAISREIESGSNDYFLSQITIQGNNIIHLAVQHDRLDFLNTVVGFVSFPSLMRQRNSNGDTPLHTAAKGGNIVIVKLLVEREQELEAVDSEQPPWKVKNLEGNTPLHLALIHGKVWVASYLVKVSPDAAGFVNNSNETPLHLAVRYDVEGDKESAMETIQVINTHLVGLMYKGCPIAEDSLSIIQLLLDKNSSAACLYDIDHLTPLLRAALKSHLLAIKSIISECPESVEMLDHNGGTILHHFKPRSYEQAGELLKITEVQSLRNQQDHDGNTPAHVAVKNCNVDLVRALLECSANFTIKNKEGVSAATLVHQLTNSLSNKTLKVMFDHHRAFDETDSKMMPPQLFEAAVKGGVEFLRQKLDMNQRDYLLSRTYDGMNIIHVACHAYAQSLGGEEAKCILFIKEALQSLPVLICQIDSEGNTPLHVLAPCIFVDDELLELCKRCFQNAKDEAACCNEELFCPPWRVKNLFGNTPVHEALQHFNAYNANKLIDFDNEAAQDVNNKRETILHSLCLWGGTNDEEIDFTIRANVSALDACDSEGLTPFLKAGKRGHARLALKMIEHNPRVTMQRDANGNTMLHWMASAQYFYESHARELIKRMSKQWYTENNDGTTPPQLAIEKGSFDILKLYMEEGFSLKAKNSKGLSCIKLLGSASEIPQEFQKYLWKRPWLNWMVFGVWTMCGIPTSEIKDYINTMSVTAALLATITFTAAFTVPGGFNSQDGTPILVRKTAFCVFMVSDIAAMCLSMMVLFSLLWIMTGNRRDKVVLVDLSIFLLQASFYATLLAFMMGVYVTIIPTVQWLAILSCIACSVSILLMQKRFIMGLVRCFQRIIYPIYQLVSYLVGESIRYLAYKISRAFAKIGLHQISRLFAKIGLHRPSTQNDEGNNSPRFFALLDDVVWYWFE